MVTWMIKEYGPDDCDVLRNGRAFSPSVTFDEALRRIRRDRRYSPSDRVIHVEPDGATTKVKMPARPAR